MIILTGNTHEYLDEKLHDTDFLVCSVGDLAYLQVECGFKRHNIDDVTDELEDYGVTVTGLFADLSDADIESLMFLLGKNLRNNVDPSYYTQICLDLRSA